MFLTGFMLQHNYSRFYARLSGKFPIVGRYTIAVLTEHWFGQIYKLINPVLFFALVTVSFAAAFSNPG